MSPPCSHLHFGVVFAPLHLTSKGASDSGRGSLCMCSGFCLSGLDGFPNLILSWYRASPWLQQALGAVITCTSRVCSDFASLCIPGSSRLPDRIPKTQASCCQAPCFAEGRNYKQKLEMPLLRYESQQSPASWPGAGTVSSPMCQLRIGKTRSHSSLA